jgi:hypothetical protein
MESHAEPQRRVLGELLWDPTVNVDVQVTMDHGTLALSGSMASYTEKCAFQRIKADGLKHVGPVVRT